ncbi:MAG: hypothetical protein Q8R15_05045 [Candidatus Micrarchaeota archaeon]|nr:hypothetical protein [Candidatus Micrarchaeota archaeon]
MKKKQKKHSFHNKFLISLVLVVAIGAILTTTNAASVIGNVLYFQSAAIVTCIDSDGGNNTRSFGSITLVNLFSNGTISSNVVQQDYCSGSFISEYYCVSNNNGTVNGTREVYPGAGYGNYYGNCSNGCSSGACNPSNPSTPICTDTDGGIVNGTAGTVTVSSDTFSSSISDRCDDSRRLYEFSCSSPTASSITTTVITCGLGGSCLNGACVGGSIASNLFICTDSDGITRLANGTTIFGVINTTVYGSVNLTNASSGTLLSSSFDSCFNSTYVNENYCLASSAQNTSISRTIRFPCPSGTTCSAGRCAPVSLTYTCRDTDGGALPSIRGNVTITRSSGAPTIGVDTCVNSTYVGEYSCSNSTASSLTYGARRCSSGQACRNGACTSTVRYTCTDTDATNANNAGYVTTTSPTGTARESFDRCLDLTHVTEYRCSLPTASSATSSTVTCLAGRRCLNGACTTVTYACRDSEIGSLNATSNLTTAGNVTVTPSIGSPVVNLDSCAGTGSVREYTCASPTASRSTGSTVACPSGTTCSSGRCS